MKKLKVGLIGTGLIGKQHAESIGRIPGIELSSITEANTALLGQLKEYYGVNAYSDWREMINKENPDVIHNCTPNVAHYEINKYALEQGIHVYGEKPLAITVEQGEELTLLAQSKKLANGVNFNYRNNAIVQDMRARMASGDTGRPLLIHGTYIQDWLLYDSDFNWRLESKEGGRSRALADIGSHWFDTVQVVTGSRIVAVYARNFISHPVRRQADKGGSTIDFKVETEDGSMVMFELDNGTCGSVIVSQVSAGYKNQLFISVDCEKYSMRWNQEQPDRLMIGTRESGVQHIYASPDAVDPSVSRYATLPSGHPAGWADAFTNGIREFYRSIIDDSYTTTTTYSDFENATYIMRIVEACLKSDKTDKWEKV